MTCRVLSSLKCIKNGNNLIIQSIKICIANKGHHYFSNTTNDNISVNNNTEYALQSQISNRRQSIHGLGDQRLKFVTDFSPLKTNDIVNDIKSQIFHSSKVTEILRIFKNNASHDLPVQLYGIGLAKLSEFGDWKACINFFEFICDQNIARNPIIYNTLFNILCKNDQMKIAQKFLLQMISNDEISPNIVILTTLISGCKYRTNVAFAEEFWQMIFDYKLESDADCALYNAMISVYCKAGMVERAEFLFNELKKIKNGIMSQNIAILSTMMNVYASQANIKKVNEYFNICLNDPQLKKKMSSVQLTVVMKCYLLLNSPKKALKVSKKYSNVFGVVSDVEFNLKCAAYLQLICCNGKYDGKKAIRKLFHSIPKQRGKIGLLPINENIAKIQMQAILHTNGFAHEDKEILAVFHSLQKQNFLGFWCIGKSCIQLDFHGYNEILVKFLLNYIFKYERENIQKMDIPYLICGKGVHKDMQMDRKNIFISDIIVDELNSWTPSISCVIDAENSGRLILNKQDIELFFLQN